MYTIFGVRVKSGPLDLKNTLEVLQNFSIQNDIAVQIFNAKFIYGIDHLTSAFDHATRAFSENRGHSNSLAMEVLLYASGEYQIKNALSKLGLSNDTKEIAVMVLGEDKDKPEDKMIKDFIGILNSSGTDVERDDKVLIGDKNTLEEFGITKKELAVVPEDRWLDLVLERVAMVDLKK